MTTAPMTMPATVCVVMVLPHLARRKKAPAQCLRPQRRGVRTVSCRNDTRSEGGDCRRKGAAEPQQKGRLTKESRPPEQTIPEAGFFLSVGSAVVKNNPQFLIASKSCEKQRKTAYFRRNKLFSGAAGRIRTADLILTNCSKAPKVLLSSAFGVFLFQRCVAFGAFRSMCSIRSFPRVGHGVGQAETSASKKPRTGFIVIFRFAVSLS